MNFKRNTTLSIRRRHRPLQRRRLVSVAKKLEPRYTVDFGLMSATKRRSCFPSVVYKLALNQGGRATTTRHACRPRFAKRESRVIYFGSMLGTRRFAFVRRPGEASSFFSIRRVGYFLRAGILLDPASARLYGPIRDFPIAFVFQKGAPPVRLRSCTYHVESIDKKKISMRLGSVKRRGSAGKDNDRSLDDEELF